MVCQKNKQIFNERLVRFFLKKAYPEQPPSLEQLILDNVISGTQLSEIAISRTAGVKLDDSGIGKDLEDDSDIKTATVFEEMRADRPNIRHVVSVNKLRSKVGMIRLVCYNPFFDSWHYFKIPPGAFSSVIKINFDKKTGKSRGKYRSFEINNWREFCLT